MKLSAELKNSGYAVLRDALSPEDNRGVRRLLRMYISRTHPTKNEPVLATKHKVGSEAYNVSTRPIVDHFMGILRRPKVLAYFPEYGLEPKGLIVQVTKEGCGIPWHRDIGRRIPPGHVFSCLTYPFSRTTQAKINVVPKSHRRGRMPSGSSFGSMPNSIEIVVSASDILILDGKIFHSVPVLTDATERISVVQKFVSNRVKFDRDLGVGEYRTGQFNYVDQLEVP